MSRACYGNNNHSWIVFAPMQRAVNDRLAAYLRLIQNPESERRQKDWASFGSYENCGLCRATLECSGQALGPEKALAHFTDHNCAFCPLRAYNTITGKANIIGCTTKSHIRLRRAIRFGSDRAVRRAAQRRISELVQRFRAGGYTVPPEAAAQAAGWLTRLLRRL